MIRVGLDRIKLIHSDLTIILSLEMGRFKTECPVLTSAVRTTPFLSGNVSLTLPKHHLSLGSTSLTSKTISSCLMFRWD